MTNRSEFIAGLTAMLWFPTQKKIESVNIIVTKGRLEPAKTMWDAFHMGFSPTSGAEYVHFVVQAPIDRLASIVCLKAAFNSELNWHFQDCVDVNLFQDKLHVKRDAMKGAFDLGRHLRTATIDHKMTPSYSLLSSAQIKSMYSMYRPLLPEVLREIL